MTRLEILTVLLSIKALLDKDDMEAVKKVVEELIEEAKNN